ncbi:MAG: metallophosphoesterase family protein [Clostridiales bacterium]|nr:metallophosphoesterase family protein [Eubacteriales bacterium]MDH7565078.1 metallophosphoesterase family protein [Clostridiales bacterium]
MKLVFFTDSHISTATPLLRKDNFYETLKNKFHEIQQIIEKENVDYVLHGGDWFDRPDISLAVAREFTVIIQSFGRPVYTVAGNHDVFAHNSPSAGRTMLELLGEMGVMKILGNEDVVVLEKDKIKLQLTGRPYSSEIDGKNFKRYYLVKKQKGVDYAVNIVHGMLLDRPIENVRFTLIDDIQDTEADITLSGHYHTGFGTIKIRSKYFINPGSIVRITGYLSEVVRRPQVAVIELSDRVTVNVVELSSALPGTDVLNMEGFLH